MKRRSLGSRDSLETRRLKRELAELRRTLAQKARELSFFIDSAKALTSTLEFNKILQVIMNRASRLTRCAAWALLLLDEPGRELRFVAAKGGAGRPDKNFRVKIGEGIAGWVAQHHRPLVIRDLRRDERFRSAADRPARLRAQSLLCVPIVSKRKTIGVLEMINKKDGAPFDAVDQDLLTKFADQAAIALERSSLYEQMASLATTDDLTKLYNFRFFDQALEAELERARRYGSAFTILFLDMDYFKRVNDTKGHLVGSRVLVEVGELLRRNLRSIDVIARYGGDEFVALMPETPVKSGLRIAQRLHKAIAEHDFLASEGMHLRLTASFGVAGCPDHAQSKKDLVRLADQAMYSAKNSGRNQVAPAQPVITPGKRRR